MKNNFLDLDTNDLYSIDGGVAPIVIIGLKILGGGVVAGACWRLGEAAYDKVKSWF